MTISSQEGQGISVTVAVTVMVPASVLVLHAMHVVRHTTRHASEFTAECRWSRSKCRREASGATCRPSSIREAFSININKAVYTVLCTVFQLFYIVHDPTHGDALTPSVARGPLVCWNRRQQPD